MEFIEKSYEQTVSHLIENGYEAKESDFALINSFSSKLENEKTNLFLLGVLINREKTPKTKIYKEGREYKAAKNVYEVYFAIEVNDIEKHAHVLRLLTDFEEDGEGNKYKLLQSLGELQENMLIKHFLQIKQSNSFSSLFSSVFIKVETSVTTLRELPTKVPVTDVNVITKRKK